MSEVNMAIINASSEEDQMLVTSHLERPQDHKAEVTVAPHVSAKAETGDGAPALLRSGHRSSDT